MFESVIGQLDVILERFDGDQGLEKSIYRAMLESSSDEELSQRVEALGQSINQIKQEVQEQVPVSSAVRRLKI
jgi:4-aminobutyrate aminotransferase-like enzyme